MYITESLFFTILISAIAVKSLVDFLVFYFKKSIKPIGFGKIKETSSINLSDLKKIKIWNLIICFVIDFIELIGAAYLTLYFPFAIFNILLPLMAVNFVATWLVILMIKMYITKNESTKLSLAYFSIKFGIFKDVVCILLFLIYITKCIAK